MDRDGMTSSPTRVGYVVQTAETIEPYLLTIREAAEYLRKSERTMGRWLSEGRIPRVRFDENGHVYVRRVDLQKFADSHRTPPVTE